jgi:hypothetical protein
MQLSTKYWYIYIYIYIQICTNKLERDDSNSTSLEHQMNKNSWSNRFLIHSNISWAVFTCEIQIYVYASQICNGNKLATCIPAKPSSLLACLWCCWRFWFYLGGWYSGSLRETRGVVLLLNSHKAQCHAFNWSNP